MAPQWCHCQHHSCCGDRDRGAIVAFPATLGLRKMYCSRRKLEYDALLDAEFEHDPGERVRVVGGEQE